MLRAIKIRLYQNKEQELKLNNVFDEEFHL